jgi:hypothetical protein
MNISREVIKDLLPLYAAGEVSDETRDLVEQFLQTDPELRGFLGRMAEAEAILEEKPQAPDLVDAQVKSLRKTRLLLRYRGIVMGAAIAYSIAPFSFVYAQGKVTWVVMENVPREVWLCCLVIAAALWIVYGVILTQTRRSGI